MTAASVAAAGLMLSVMIVAETGITVTVRTMDAETTGERIITVETTGIIIRGIMLRLIIRKPIMRQAITWSDARFAVFTITMATGRITAIATVSVSV